MSEPKFADSGLVFVFEHPDLLLQQNLVIGLGELGMLAGFVVENAWHVDALLDSAGGINFNRWIPHRVEERVLETLFGCGSEMRVDLEELVEQL